VQPAPNCTVFDPPAEFALSIASTNDVGSPTVPEHPAVNVAADADPPDRAKTSTSVPHSRLTRVNPNPEYEP